MVIFLFIIIFLIHKKDLVSEDLEKILDYYYSTKYRKTHCCVNPNLEKFPKF